MENKTLQDAVDLIISNGCNKDLIVGTLRSIFEQGYRRGYMANTSDSVKARAAMARAKDKNFKKEIDMIDDVIKSKWA